MNRTMTDPQDVEEARRAVEESRERLSDTLDELETKLVEKKHELKDRVNVLRPAQEQVRSRPWTSVAVAVGVGAALGALGRGSASREGKEEGASTIGEEDRESLREWRRERRERLERLESRARKGGKGVDGKRGGALHDIRTHVVAALSTAISDGLSERVKKFTEPGAR